MADNSGGHGPHSHRTSDKGKMIYRRVGDGKDFDTGTYADRGKVAARQEYIDHAGRATSVTEYESGRADIFVGDDQVGRWKTEAANVPNTVTGKNLKQQEWEARQAERARKQQEYEARKAEQERKKREWEARQAERARKQQEYEARKAEQERKKREWEARQAERARKQQEYEARKAQQQREYEARQAEKQRKQAEYLARQAARSSRSSSMFDPRPRGTQARSIFDPRPRGKQTKSWF
ncbi:hypothetical protein [Pseudarthrobacter sp. C4D7]|uniref:hypothetical protein n=1 Tax=Pseudarthrobacter sp. C4D7 TaxID=2735268 RepID=UPI0015847104|nr:hypothetical protein [Pseudarthrobacter sp. C4D7]NUT72149.1 hypothetical protein [Pseudarthrobacter sp. C4D7]